MALTLGAGVLATEREQLLDRARAVAATLALAARHATTLGRERAILRLIGVSGLDREGRPLAAEVVDQFVDGRPDRLAMGIGLPFAVALLEYDSDVQALALDIAGGAVDLGLEAELLSIPERRAAALEHLEGLVGSAVNRIDANRVARSELVSVLRDRQRPWIGATLGESAIDAAEAEAAMLVRTGIDLIRVEVPVIRELAVRLGELGQDVAWRPQSGPLDAEATPAGSQRGLSRLRDALDQSAAERGAYVRLAIAPTALAGPEGAVVAAFERADLLDLDPMAEIVVTGVDPERAMADFGFAVRVARRAGVAVHLGSGPLVVAPELGTGVNSDPATRSGRALALQMLAAFVAEAEGMSPAQVIVGALPAWLSGEPDAAAQAAAEIALRRALLPENPLAFVEPDGGGTPSRWPAIVAGVQPGSGVGLVVRRGDLGAGGLAAAAASARSGSDVARELDGTLGDRPLDGTALRHAVGALREALRTLDTIEREGWPALTGATPARGGWGRLGAEAVAPAGGPADPIERLLA